MKQYWPLVFVFALVLLLYYPIFNVYFSHDDFFHFKVSQTESLREFVNLFGFHPFQERSIGFYRPIFRELLFNSFYSFFGLDHLPFRLFSILLHFVNICLVYVFVQRIFANRLLSFFVSLFFGIDSANVAALYYLTGGVQILGATMFILLTLIFFWQYLEDNKVKFKIFSFLTFALSLASHEMAATMPFLLVGLVFLKGKKQKFFSTCIQELWIFIVLVAIYLYLDIFKVGFSQGEEQYQMVFSIKRTLNSLVWYWVWALGLPEMLVDFVRPGLSLNPSLIRHWGNYFAIIFPTFFGAIILLAAFIVYLGVKVKKFFSDKRFWFFVLWFPVGILPVVFLPVHKSSYYLAPVLPAFWGALGLVVFGVYKSLFRRHKKIAITLIGAFVLLLLLLSVASIRLGDKTYPAAVRGRLAEKLINDMKLQYPELPPGVVVYFKNDPDYPLISEDWGGTSKQAAFILNREDALQLFYKDRTLRVFYEDLDTIPEDISKDKIYEIVARLAY